MKNAVQSRHFTSDILLDADTIKNQPETVRTLGIPGKSSILYAVVKRLVDVFLSSVVLLLLTPLLMLVAILIKLDSPGPVVFKQKRVGKDQKLFTIYKFRTMVDHAEGFLGEMIEKNIIDRKMLKVHNDPRVTRIGKVIRKLSIDELPQLINVIIGDMSLIGPRPTSPMEVEQYDEWCKVRLSVLPGISGLWQASGRSRLGFEKMMELDYEYVMNRGLLLDTIIILQTIPAVFRCEGAE